MDGAQTSKSVYKVVIPHKPNLKVDNVFPVPELLALESVLFVSEIAVGVQNQVSVLKVGKQLSRRKI